MDSLDWKGISAADITKRVTTKVQSGSIVLFHNAGEHTPEALPDILDYLIGEGYDNILPAGTALSVIWKSAEEWTPDYISLPR